MRVLKVVPRRLFARVLGPIVIAVLVVHMTVLIVAATVRVIVRVRCCCGLHDGALPSTARCSHDVIIILRHKDSTHHPIEAYLIRCNKAGRILSDRHHQIDNLTLLPSSIARVAFHDIAHFEAQLLEALRTQLRRV